MQKKLVRGLALACVMCAAAPGVGFGQSAVDGAISGVVRDPSGAAVAAAQVKVVNNGTAAEQNLMADDQGNYRAIHLQPGSYTVTVTGSGFGEYRSTSVTVQVGAVTNVDANLAAAGASEVVEVTADVPTINTSSPDFANVIDLNVLGNLPVNNYRWSSYALLTPGVVETGGFGLLSFRGQSSLQNNVTIDGADDNQAFFAEERGRTRAGYSTAQSSIQEFQVNTSNYTVEYGRAAGGVVNAITKSGTNTFHGDLYYQDRDAEWGTKNPFTQIATLNPATGLFSNQVFKPKDKRAQYGGAIGGPILRDKLFFFFAGDRYFRNFPGTAVAGNPNSFFTLPDANLPAGKACNGTGAAAPSSIDGTNCTLATNLNVTYAQAAQDYTGGITGLNSMLGPVPRTGDQTIFFPKIDAQINGRNHASFEVNRLNWNSPAGIQTQATNTNGIRSYGNDYVKLTFGVAKLDTTITNSLVNQVRYQYGRDFEFEFAQQPTAYEQNNLLKSTGYASPYTLAPAVSITNAFTFGTPTFLQRGAYPDERRWQVADTANYTRGKHNIKFGLDYLHTNDLSSNLRYQFGSFSYSSLLNYFTDLYRSQGTAAQAGAARSYSTYQQIFGQPGFEFQTQDYGFFLQDEWKATQRLILTLGARYDYQKMPNVFANVANPDLPLSQGIPDDKNNIGPRAGFAYDVYGNGKTSVRGGFGVFYGRTINSTIYNALTSTGSRAVQADGTTPTSQLSFTYNGGNPANPNAADAGAPNFPRILASARNAPAPSAVFFAKNFQSPYVYQIDLAVQQDVGWNTAISVSYLGALGRELTNFVDTNLPTPTSTITYTVVDPGAFGKLRPGTTFTTPFYARGAASNNCAVSAGGPPTTITSSRRPDCRYGSLSEIVSNVNSNYHALVGQISHRFTQRLSFDANYTWSHALDYGINNSTFSDTNDAFDPTNPRGDYGNANTNIPNRLVVYAVYQTPAHYESGLRKFLLNDYEISPSFQGQNGAAYSGTISGTPSAVLTSAGPQGGISGGLNGSGGATRFPLLGRNTFSYRRALEADLRVSKRFDIRENMNFELLLEAFNLANHQNWTGANGTAYFLGTTTNAATKAVTGNTLTFNANTAGTAPLFGTETNANSNTAYSPRQVQVGARFHF